MAKQVKSITPVINRTIEALFLTHTHTYKRIACPSISPYFNRSLIPLANRAINKLNLYLEGDWSLNNPNHDAS